MGGTGYRFTRRQFLTQTVGASVLVLGGATLVGCGGGSPAPAPTKLAESKPAAAAPAQKIVLRFSHSHAPDPVNSAIHYMALKFQDLVAKKTNNAVEIQIFPANQLGEERAVVEQVKMGGIDIMSTGTAIWANFAPKMGLLDLPYIFKDFDHAHKVLDGPAVGTELVKHCEETTGARIIGWYDSFGFRHVNTKTKEVKTLEDLRGLKIRVIQTPTYVKTFELLGASATPMAFGEVYTSLQTGVLDGWEHDGPTIVAQKIYEVTKYLTLTGHLFGVLSMNINAKRMDSLPPDAKKAVEEAATEACKYARDRAPQAEQDSFKFLKEKGIGVNDFDKTAAAERVKSYWKDYAAEVKATDLLTKMTS